MSRKFLTKILALKIHLDFIGFRLQKINESHLNSKNVFQELTEVPNFFKNIEKHWKILGQTFKSNHSLAKPRKFATNNCLHENIVSFITLTFRGNINKSTLFRQRSLI